MNFSPCVVSGLSGAELILSPGTLAQLGATHLYESSTIRFTKLKMSMQLFRAPIVADWLENHRKTNFISFMDKNP